MVSSSSSPRPSRKRITRIGTRSVTTLSATQLERKRANDREAQRAIRQRTREHIEQLEGTVIELRHAQQESEKLARETQRRNNDLARENVYLQAQLQQAKQHLEALSPMSDDPQSDGLHLRVPSISSGHESVEAAGGTHATTPAMRLRDHASIARLPAFTQRDWQASSVVVDVPSGTNVSTEGSVALRRQSVQEAQDTRSEHRHGDLVQDTRRGESWSNTSAFDHGAKTLEQPQSPCYVTSSTPQQSNYDPTPHRAMAAAAGFQSMSELDSMMPQTTYAELSSTINAPFEHPPLISETSMQLPTGQTASAPLRTHSFRPPNLFFHPEYHDQGLSRQVQEDQSRNKRPVVLYSLSSLPTGAPLWCDF